MAIKITNKKISIHKEIELLRSAIIGFLGKDREGAYRSDFVEKILAASHEKPVHEFKNKETFLTHIRNHS